MIKAESLRDHILKINKRPWQPLDIASVNNHRVRLGCFKGSYGWYKHEGPDDFLVLSGKIKIELKDQPTVALNKSEYVVLPKGTLHNLSRECDSDVLVFQPVHLTTELDKK